jgi:hypothetical protein
MLNYHIKLLIVSMEVIYKLRLELHFDYTLKNLITYLEL